MKSADIRTAFLNYFAERGHEIVPSSSLVPVNDPTLLFVNAGMVQFKDVFIGADKRPYDRATSSQRCVRAGGKHNDLDNVGYTARHHTFFEMLGNFSFGDYFKRDAIKYCWELLTEVYKLPPEKLWVTVYKDDQEAEDIWLKEMGVDPSRFSRCGEEDNFWSMGDTGPCGPCSEVFYDHGSDVAGGPPGSPEQEGDRYIEIWNLVFMQYDRLPSGELQPLPKPSVDTGMGLERISAVLQGVHNNYDTDLFTGILKAIAKLCGDEDITNTSMRVIADHIRACAFLITDGVIPSNEGRGYVLRRIIRRAVRHGHQLGLKDLFFYKLVKPLVDVMGDAYPELSKAQQHVEHILKQEEEQFAKTLEQGLRILENVIADLKDRTIPGEIIFKLYDTYGFPADLTADIAREKNLAMDYPGFDEHMAKQRGLSQASNKFAADYHDKIVLHEETEFTGYHQLQQASSVTKLFKDNKEVDSLQQGEQGIVVLENTPFYAESGGQVGDVGCIEWSEGRFEVKDTQKQGKSIIHLGEITKGSLSNTQDVVAEVNLDVRQATVLNHSATHLLHAALRELLGEHVQQKGSLVAPDKLRFDFSHFEAVTREQLYAIEYLVNEKIRENIIVDTHIMSQQEAMDKGAMALFGEKYDDEVRVLQMGNFSMELCGGTHVARTGDIGLFKIVAETGIAAGVRRVEAVTGDVALRRVESSEVKLNEAMKIFKADRDSLPDKIKQSLDRQRELEKQVQNLQRKLATGGNQNLADSAKDIKGIKVLATSIDGVDVKTLRESVDHLKNQLQHGVIVLATVDDGSIRIVVGVTKDLCEKIPAGKLANFVAGQLGGKGGGRPDMAQAGGSEPDKLPAALDSVDKWVAEQL